MDSSADRPLVSVVVAVHDSERYLPLCLDTILRQTLSNIEVICVDDGSVDGSLEILRRYSEKDGRVIVLSQENKGAGAARNLGLEKARGRYLSFLDSDDFFDETMLEQLYLTAEIYDLDIAICQAYEYDDQSKRIDRVLTWAAQKDKFKKDVFSYKDCPDEIFQYINTWAWNKLIRAELIHDNNVRFQELMSSNDNLFVTMALSLAERMMILNDALVYYRVNNPDSLQRSKEKTWPCSMDSSYGVRDSLIKAGKYDELKQSFLNKALKNVIYYYESIPYDSPAREPMQKRLLEEFVPRMGFKNYPRDFYYDQLLIDKLHWISTHPYRRSTLPIVFASDNNYAKQMYVTAYSILKNKLETTAVDFYLLIDDTFEDRYVQDIRELASSYPNTLVHAVRMGDRFKDASLTISHITTPTYYRLAMADILPEEYDKCLYLDTDLIVTSDLSDYFSLDMQDSYVAGVKAAAYIMNYANKGYLLSIGVRDVREYINAGAVLYNLKKIREDNLTPELMKRIGYGYSSQDQDIINSVFSSHIGILPLKCNLMTKYDSFFDRSLPEYKRIVEVYPEYEIKDSVAHPLIIHYAGAVKPWNGLDQKYSELWWEYANECPYSDYRTNVEDDAREVSPVDLMEMLEKMVRKIDSLESRFRQQTDQLNSLKKMINGLPTDRTSEPSNKINTVKESDRNGYYRKAQAYRYGIGVEKDLEKYIEYIMLASDNRPSYILNEVFPVLESMGRNDLIQSISEDSAHRDDVRFMLYLAEKYRQGKNVAADTEKAIHYYRKAVDAGSVRSVNILIDLLCLQDSSECRHEAFTIAEKHLYLDDPGTYGRMARMYRDGDGVARDIDRSIRYMRLSANGGVVWAKLELFDLLWDRGEYTDLVSLVEDLHDRGNIHATFRLGKCYYYGRGVEPDGPYGLKLMNIAADSDRTYRSKIDQLKSDRKNIDVSDDDLIEKYLEEGNGYLECGGRDYSKAQDCFEKAVGLGSVKAVNQLIDILLSQDLPAKDKAAFELAERYSDKGDSGTMGRLGRMYRDGRGVEPDIDKAVAFLRGSSDGGVVWAKMDLFDLLWDNYDDGSSEEMFGLVKDCSDSDNVGMLFRLGKCHYFGRGVEPDKELGLELMGKAAMDNSYYTKKMKETLSDTVVSPWSHRSV